MREEAPSQVLHTEATDDLGINLEGYDLDSNEADGTDTNPGPFRACPFGCDGVDESQCDETLPIDFQEPVYDLGKSGWQSRDIPFDQGIIPDEFSRCLGPALFPRHFAALQSAHHAFVPDD
jgi:hypothetical protein